MPIEYDSDVLDVGNDGSEHTLDNSNKTQHLIPFDKPAAFGAEKSKHMPTPTLSNNPTTPISASAAVLAKSQKRKKNSRNKDSGTSSDEERWLDAIQSGKQVEQVEIKKMKDPKLMTARQRAMYERGNDKETSTIPSADILMALPSGYKEKVMTAEAIQKAAIKSQKRKQLADEKREKEKKRTMERLLKKQDSRANKNQRARPAKSVEPVVSYRSTQCGMTITFPPDFDMPLFGSRRQPMPAHGVGGGRGSASGAECSMCGAAKRYNCSRTNIPLCSLKCYKLNVESLKEIMC